MNGVYSFLLQFSFPLKKLVFEKAFFLIKDNIYCYMQKGECKRHRKPNCSCCIRDHTYTTSAHFWTFSDTPPTLCLHKWYWTSKEIANFLTPPTQSLFWRIIRMIPYTLVPLIFGFAFESDFYSPIVPSDKTWLPYITLRKWLDSAT